MITEYLNVFEVVKIPGKKVRLDELLEQASGALLAPTLRISRIIVFLQRRREQKKRQFDYSLAP